MERLQYATGSRFDFAELVTPLVQQRAETLLVAVFRELLDRGRKVRVSSDGYAWSQPVRSAGALDNTDWGKLTGYVDGIQVCFDWTPVRDQRSKEYPQDRLCIRWSRDREGNWRGRGWKPSSDGVRLLEPKAADFDPLVVVEAFERWLAERKRDRKQARERAAAAEARAKLQTALEDEANAALPHMLGADGVTVNVGSSTGAVGIHVHWNNLTATDARALLAALQAAHDMRDDRKAAEAFAIPE